MIRSKKASRCVRGRLAKWAFESGEWQGHPKQETGNHPAISARRVAMILHPSQFVDLGSGFCYFCSAPSEVERWNYWITNCVANYLQSARFIIPLTKASPWSMQNCLHPIPA